jgi:hypothetical protein
MCGKCGKMCGKCGKMCGKCGVVRCVVEWEDVWWSGKMCGGVVRFVVSVEW